MIAKTWLKYLHLIFKIYDFGKKYLAYVAVCFFLFMFYVIEPPPTIVKFSLFLPFFFI